MTFWLVGCNIFRTFGGYKLRPHFHESWGGAFKTLPDHQSSDASFLILKSGRGRVLQFCPRRFAQPSLVRKHAPCNWRQSDSSRMQTTSVVRQVQNTQHHSGQQHHHFKKPAITPDRTSSLDSAYSPGIYTAVSPLRLCEDEQQHLFERECFRSAAMVPRSHDKRSLVQKRRLSLCASLRLRTSRGL